MSGDCDGEDAYATASYKGGSQIAGPAPSRNFNSVPAVMHRPPLDHLQGPSISALRMVYAMDPPANLFPSFHAALATVVLLVPLRSRRLRVAVALWMIGICVSCALTKQHYVLDVVAGVLVGVFVVAVGERIAGRLERLCDPRGERVGGL